MPIIDCPGASTDRRRPRRIGLTALGLLTIGLMAGAPARADDDQVAELRRQLAEKDQEIERLKAKIAETPGDSASSAVVEAPVVVAPLDEIVGESEPTLTIPPPPAPDAKPSAIFDNLSLFGGFDGSKEPQDFGVNALFGGRAHINWGIPLFRERGIGLQVGTGINATPNAVQVFDRIQGTKGRLQSFTTVGLYKRGESGLNWALGYDFLYEQYFDHFHLGQWRGRVGYELNERNEVGVNVMLRGYGSSGYFNKIPVNLHSINMTNLFYRHAWNSGVNTTFWVGLADGHNEPNAALGDAGPVHHPFVYGAQIDAPLNDRFAIFGQANFITPPSTGTVDAFLGIVFHPVSRSTRERSKQFRPILPIANNPTFAVDLGRGR